MTDTELEQSIMELKKKTKAGELTQEEVDSWLKVNKALYGKCFGCRYNDDIPHSCCWNCD